MSAILFLPFHLCDAFLYSHVYDVLIFIGVCVCVLSLCLFHFLLATSLYFYVCLFVLQHCTFHIKIPVAPFMDACHLIHFPCCVGVYFCFTIFNKLNCGLSALSIMFTLETHSPNANHRYITATVVVLIRHVI